MKGEATRAVQCQRSLTDVIQRLSAEGYNSIEIIASLCMANASFATFLFETGRIKHGDFERWKRTNAGRLAESMQMFHDKEGGA